MKETQLGILGSQVSSLNTKVDLNTSTQVQTITQTVQVNMSHWYKSMQVTMSQYESLMSSQIHMSQSESPESQASVNVSILLSPNWDHTYI